MATRRVRSTLLHLYGRFVAFTGALPAPVRSRVDTWASRVLLGVANTPRHVLEATFDDVLGLLQAGEDGDGMGDYLEFGVCLGSSLACIHRVAERRGVTGMRFFGFDSFEGLPPNAHLEDGAYWRPRMFAADIDTTRRLLTRAGVDWSKTCLVPGWFSETLTQACIDTHGLRKASVVMIDCDTYGSSREALAFCRPLLGQRAVLIFDDWRSGGLHERDMGQKRAFDEFLAHGDELVAEAVGEYPPNGQMFLIARQRAVRESGGDALP